MGFLPLKFSKSPIPRVAESVYIRNSSSGFDRACNKTHPGPLKVFQFIGLCNNV
jgi:hypothetical protein